jgi:hypothetical protein
MLPKKSPAWNPVEPLAGLERRENDLDIGFAGELDVGAAEPEALRPEADLGHGLLAGDIDDTLAGIGECRSGLQQQRGLADARVAADQNRRAHDEPAAGHSVEFTEPRNDARRGLGLARERHQRNGPTIRRRRLGASADARVDRLLDDRVPLAAALAPPLPAHMRGAAGLADISELGFGHRRSRVRILVREPRLASKNEE